MSTTFAIYLALHATNKVDFGFVRLSTTMQVCCAALPQVQHTRPACLGLQIIMSCIYLAHYELESVLIVAVAVTITVTITIVTDCEPDEGGSCD